MTKGVIVPLESYRLAEYSRPVDCYICEGQNNFDAEFCRYCGAPIALAHQAASSSREPQLVAMIGASGVGKTVYLGMLMDMLSRQPNRIQLLARGAFSITLQQTTIAALARCRFPAKTPNEPDRWHWVHCEIRRPRRRQPINLIIPDMAGEALLEEVDHPNTYKAIANYMQKATAALVLIDAAKIKEGNRNQEYFTMKLAGYLAELAAGGNAKAWRKKPVAFVFTKADQCDECLRDPVGFAQSRATGLWQQAKERFPNSRFFAATVTGACAWHVSPSDGRTFVPLRIEPHGIVEPFFWLLEGLK